MKEPRVNSQLQVLRVSFLERYNKSPSDSSLTESKELGKANAVVTRNDGKREAESFGGREKRKFRGMREKKVSGEEKSMWGERERQKEVNTKVSSFERNLRVQFVLCFRNRERERDRNGQK